MKVGIVGAGLMGRRWAHSIKNNRQASIVVISASRIERARELASQIGCEAEEGWQGVVKRKDVDAVLVCTPPGLHAAVSIDAMREGKHVLCEKPLARNVEEARRMVEVMKESKLTLGCGFNLRYHPGIVKAHELSSGGSLGNLYYVRCRYGIIGRPDIDQEWRGKRSLIGGGQLMEQGIHAIDLARWFLGEFEVVIGSRANYHWKMDGLEDNAFVLMKTRTGEIANIHASLTQWKNLFSFELFGSEGYVEVEGLGGGYGVEKLHFGRRDFAKPFEEQVIEYRGEDKSLAAEFADFARSIESGLQPLASGEDGLAAMRLVEAAYESDRLSSTVKLSW